MPFRKARASIVASSKFTFIANLTDNQLRGIALRKAYDKRSVGFFAWSNDDFKDLDPSIDFDIQDLFRVCEQLDEYNLIQFKSAKGIGGKIMDGRVKITPSGVDVIEGQSASPIAINYDQSHRITVTSSSNVQVGNSNTQDIQIHLESLVKAIESSSGSDTDKNDAKNLLRRFLEHPLVSSVVGGVISNLKL